MSNQLWFFIGICIPYWVFSQAGYFHNIDQHPYNTGISAYWHYGVDSAHNFGTSTGNIWGGSIVLEKQRAFQPYKRLAISWDGGRFSMQSTPYRDIWTHSYTAHATMGYMLVVGEKEWLGMIPYAGYLFAYSSNSTTIDSANAYYNTHAYNSAIPLGVLLEFAINPSLSLGFLCEAQVQFASQVKATSVHTGSAAIGQDVPFNGEKLGMPSTVSWIWSLPLSYIIANRLEIACSNFYCYKRDCAYNSIPAIRILHHPVKSVSFGFSLSLAVKW